MKLINLALGSNKENLLKYVYIVIISKQIFWNDLKEFLIQRIVKYQRNISDTEDIRFGKTSFTV